MREWIELLNDIDRDCVEQYEALLGRELKDYEEYHEIDSLVDEMILEWEDRDEFFEKYPEIKKYADPEPVKNECIHLEARLGISLQVTSEEMQILKKEDAAAKELLVNLIHSDRSMMGGDTYFPEPWNEENLSKELNFDLPYVPLHSVERLERPEELAVWVCVYKDALGFPYEDDNLTEICVPTKWLLNQLKNDGVTSKTWFDEYTADDTDGIARTAVSEGIILDCSDEKIKRSLLNKFTSLDEQIRNASNRTSSNNTERNEKWKDHTSR